MGLSISDAIRLLLLRIADERRLPFEVRVPNATTRKAMVEAESIRHRVKRISAFQIILLRCLMPGHGLTGRVVLTRWLIKNRRARFHTPEELFHDLEKAAKH